MAASSSPAYRDVDFFVIELNYVDQWMVVRMDGLASQPGPHYEQGEEQQQQTHMHTHTHDCILCNMSCISVCLKYSFMPSDCVGSIATFFSMRLQ